MKIGEAILETCKYAAKYGQILNPEQIKERLLGKEIYSNGEICRGLKSLGTEYHLHLKERDNETQKNYKEKLEKAKMLAEGLGNKFKEILYIGVTGSVAAEDPDKEDDIDLMIITERNRLWLTRLRMRWFIFANNIPHRKYGQDQKENEFCFNLWLEDEKLELPRNKQNLKNAVDMVLMKSVWNMNGTYERFLIANKWAKNWVATPYNNKFSIFNFQFSKEDKNPLYSPFTRGNKGFLKELLNFLNVLCFGGQWLWMRPKIRRETVSLTQAFFHKN